MGRPAVTRFSRWWCRRTSAGRRSCGRGGRSGSVAELVVGGEQVGRGDRGQVGGAGGLAEVRDAQVAGRAGALEQGAGEPAVAQLVDAALGAGLAEDAV